MTELLIAAYGVATYLLGLATILYAIAFVGDLPVPRTLDAGPTLPVAQAVAGDSLLLAAFALQHTVMARVAFKRALTRVVSPAIERSTYVLAASLALAALMWPWRPLAEPVIWNVRGHAWAAIAIEIVCWAGWLLVLFSSFLIDHFEMFGLRQVAARVFGLKAPAPQFRTPSLYRVVRHPLYVGFLMAFWATPRMTAGHLLFASAMTGYILLGIRFEERDLVALFGRRYRDYQRSVGMLLPGKRS